VPPDLIDSTRPGTYHLISRCVRHEPLLDRGERKVWLCSGQANWLSHMGIDLLAYAVMGNRLFFFIQGLRPYGAPHLPLALSGFVFGLGGQKRRRMGFAHYMRPPPLGTSACPTLGGASPLPRRAGHRPSMLFSGSAELLLGMHYAFSFAIFAPMARRFQIGMLSCFAIAIGAYFIRVLVRVIQAS